MSQDDDLSHSLRMLFGLPPAEPTPSQLASIKLAIARIQESGRNPTKEDWERAVQANCRHVGEASYSGIDNSSLRTLLAMAIANAKENRK